MNNKDEFFYYVEYVGSDGLQHYAIHKWNDVLKTATRMSDYRFDSLQKNDYREVY